MRQVLTVLAVLATTACSGSPGVCEPATCASLGAKCGSVQDGCGGALECGSCTAPETCGGGELENVCQVCVPESDERLCAAAARSCGPLAAVDKCGVQRDVACGACALPASCGGGGVEGQCGCTAETDEALCAEAGFECGRVERADRCGLTRGIDCGECAAPETCGGGGLDGRCGCTPEAEEVLCEAGGFDCGTIELEDRCVGRRGISCGECATPETCGGGGTPGVCGVCTITETDAQLCARRGRACGELIATDLCGTIRSVNCGGCAAPLTCGGSGTPGACGGPIDPEIAAFCAFVGANCGSVTAVGPGGFEQTRNCGECTAPTGCGLAGTPNRCGCVPTTCAALGRTCGTVPDDCGGELDCGPCPGGEAPPPYCIRVMAANTSSGNSQSYDPGHGLRIFQGLRPDVVLIQEFNFGNDSERAIRSMVTGTFGTHFWHFRENEDTDQIPNGVISRFPILEAGEWDDTLSPNRDFVWARLDVPGPRDLWVVSLHLLTRNASTRNTEAKALVEHLIPRIPPGDYLVIGGDLNTDSRLESCIDTLSQLVVTAGPYPVDEDGRGGTNATRVTPLDWVLASPLLDGLEEPVRIGSLTHPSGLVFDSRVYTKLDEVAPVLLGDSGAQNMQHMAVVRDFCLPLQ